MSMLKLVLKLLGSALLLGAQSPPQQDSLTLIKEHTRPIERGADGSFSGPAWDALVADAAAAQFTMVGEQHGSATIAHFQAALQQQLIERGYTHAALEVGPLSTAVAERLIRSGRGELHRYIAAPGHGFTMPFLFFREEADMAEAMVYASPDKTRALFGLDQEFIGSAPVLAELLEGAAQTAAQKQAVANLRAAAAKDPMLIGKVTEAELLPLQQAFAGDQTALEVVEAIRTSARIYSPFTARSGPIYPANLERETYMKTNFLRQFEEARQRNGRAPKVFLKFGGYHAMRGISGTNVPALGNFLAEWGLANGYRLVNLFIDCVGGETMNPQTNEPKACDPYFPKDGLLYRAVADGPAFQVVDLRALRPLLPQMNDADEATRKNILAFDYYVAVKGGRAATPLGTPEL